MMWKLRLKGGVIIHIPERAVDYIQRQSLNSRDWRDRLSFGELDLPYYSELKHFDFTLDDVMGFEEVKD